MLLTIFRGAFWGSLALLVACFDPSVVSNLPCADDGRCPSGLICSATLTCVAPSAIGPDAGTLQGADGGPTGPVSDGGDGPGTVVLPSPNPNWSPTMVNLADLTVTPGPLEILSTNGCVNYDTDVGRFSLNEFTPPTSYLMDPPPPAAGNDSYRVMHLESLTIGSGACLTASGRWPLVIVVNGVTVIDGTLDVSSTIEPEGIFSRIGAGASSAAACVLNGGLGQDGNGSNNGSTATGGGGGGFGASGGNGGADIGGMTSGGSGGQARAAVGTMSGGCAGGYGGANGGLPGAIGGFGGGAIAIVGVTGIAVTGKILAGGSGGQGGFGDAANFGGVGGGGGGAGGMIVLDTPALGVGDTAILAANGGGGGAGSDYGNSGQGFPGENGNDSDVPAAGGGDIGGVTPLGGAGGSQLNPWGSDADTSQGPASASGTGGGGGSVGYILVPGAGSSVSATATLSPRQTDL